MIAVCESVYMNVDLSVCICIYIYVYLCLCAPPPIRFIFDGLDDALVSTAKRVLEDAPLLQHVSVEYVPQIGYLIAVEADEQHFLTGSTDGRGGGYQFVYANEGKLYFKHEYVLALDDGIGDIKSDISDKQRELVRISLPVYVCVFRNSVPFPLPFHLRVVPLLT